MIDNIILSTWIALIIISIILGATIIWFEQKNKKK